MALRIAPADQHTSSYTHIPTPHHNAPSAPGLFDTLRAGLAPSPHDPPTLPISSHPLEARLKNWEATREALRMETLRRTYGMAEPIRRQMELKITREGEWRPMALGGGNGSASVSEEVLAGRDEMITWEDVFTGEEGRREVSVAEEMERKLKI